MTHLFVLGPMFILVINNQLLNCFLSGTQGVQSVAVLFSRGVPVRKCFNHRRILHFNCFMCTIRYLSLKVWRRTTRFKLQWPTSVTSKAPAGTHSVTFQFEDFLQCYGIDDWSSYNICHKETTVKWGPPGVRGPRARAQCARWERRPCANSAL